MAEQLVLEELQTVEDQLWSRGKEKEGAMVINNYGLVTAPLHPLFASLKRLSVTCSNNKREKRSLKSSLGKQEGCVFCFP